MRSAIWLLTMSVMIAAPAPDRKYRERVDQVRKTRGFVALWDFVKRDDRGRFAAHQAANERHDLSLDPINYVREYWAEGRAATIDDFPLLGRGPFGQAVRIKNEPNRTFRPCLIVPRERLHDSGLDVKGPGQSVSMVVWLIRESGNHAIAGIWHEGTDLKDEAGAAARVERGKRQYALFAGLAANNGAVAAHVSENGANSFGDKYARNLAVTRELIPPVPGASPPDVLDRSWSVVAFSFDNAKNTVTAYLDGNATEFWIDNPELHPFFQWAHKGWVNGEYRPPASFTRMSGKQLAALRVNPFWFNHDLYSPAEPAGGGPFTIGRVIHSGRSVGFTGYIGGVAVFNRALQPAEMRRLAAIARDGPIDAPRPR